LICNFANPFVMESVKINRKENFFFRHNLKLDNYKSQASKFFETHKIKNASVNVNKLELLLLQMNSEHRLCEMQWKLEMKDLQLEWENNDRNNMAAKDFVQKRYSVISQR